MAGGDSPSSSAAYTSPWYDLETTPEDLRLDHCLVTGQTFQWKPSLEEGMKRDSPVVEKNKKASPEEEENAATLRPTSWIGVLGENLMQFQQTEQTVRFRCLGSSAVTGPPSEEDLRSELRSYFQLGEPLAPLYDRWSAADKRMECVSGVLPGLRVIEQDPWECLISFICSSNNNIARISLILDRLRENFGPLICKRGDVLPLLSGAAARDWRESLGGLTAREEEGGDNSPDHRREVPPSASLSPMEWAQEGTRETEAAVCPTAPLHTQGGSPLARSENRNGDSGPLQPPYTALEDRGGASSMPLSQCVQTYTWYGFPSVEALCEVDEQKLREIGLGYRARSVRETALEVKARGGREWLESLRGAPREEVLEALLKFRGVGRKVADCVGLFSLRQTEAIPVDTHVWRFACRDLDPSLASCKSLTPTVYERVGNLFRNRFSPCAGWAHALIFAAELRAFRPLLPVDLQKEMEEFRESEKEWKAEEREQRKRRRDDAGGVSLSESVATGATACQSDTQTTQRTKSRKKKPGNDATESSETAQAPDVAKTAKISGAARSRKGSQSASTSQGGGKGSPEDAKKVGKGGGRKGKEKQPQVETDESKPKKKARGKPSLQAREVENQSSQNPVEAQSKGRSKERKKKETMVSTASL
uniref:DNA-(apurinic or apyrimidinic site) lyase n=1 Tax=Chromera velia CCMP2878 TaxID=1169474 RepID=A0A0G4HDJ4_9ALVE|eukprot:Cvel_26528.t1-p1 / transcript=Cvel_26528.t1 / gene=Cvel_26528 / organism=Chromera_velia_CCMP2878 / gene_product=N-glycosylase/DNA lyase, putative / transcript_product=N-glycosylase/DNA lyase, putative / location=Cvel_scaffold3170:7918-13830(+) / protein_length=648 / sequence_SO=supercontig / SO=protein_coding / is_pseudo=false